MALTFTKQILRGKTLGRALFNQQVAHAAKTLSGRVLDIAGGAGSYVAFLPLHIELVRTDVEAGEGVEVLDFNKPLPFADSSFNHVLLFNALYIAEDPEHLLREIFRVLKGGGSALIASPFLQNEMREPHDFRRFTSEGLAVLFQASGFTAYEVVPYGERFSVGANLLHSFWYFSVVRLLVYALARGLDRMIPRRLRQAHPAPIGYFCILTKK